MKNNHLQCILLLILIVFLAGCDEEFLTEIPESEYSVEGAYKTQADFEQAIAGVYDEQQSLFQANGCWFRTVNARTDETLQGSIVADGGVAQFIDDANNNWTQGAWNSFYQIIMLSNQILERIDNAEFSDETLQGYITGEAYMFRAYAYYNLSWMFGGVPLIDKVVSANEALEIPRSTQEETFAFAIKDYEEAIKLLPPAWTGGNIGRVTKYAAEGMLARLYLFQSNFNAAKPLLADIIGFGNYGMEENYIDSFNDSHDNGKERVWEVQFTGGQLGEGQWFTTGMLPEATDDPSIMPFNGYSSAMRVPDVFYNAYEVGDLRRDLTVVKGFRTRTQEIDTVSLYPVKYTHYDYEPKDQHDWAINIPVLRYTDVALMYAEVLNEEGFVADGQAFDILNMVRARAGLNPVTSSTISNKQAFKEALIKERKFEFAFEGLRWIDMVRWGIAFEKMNEFLDGPQAGGGIYSMKEYQVIFAIPFDELSRYNDESVMWQNPGY